jgi:hypothetical protein
MDDPLFPHSAVHFDNPADVILKEPLRRIGVHTELRRRLKDLSSAFERQAALRLGCRPQILRAPPCTRSR